MTAAPRLVARIRRTMRTKTNPAFYADELRLRLADEPERLERALTDPDSTDLLTWNIFSSLDTHRDPDYLAHRLQPFASELRAPLRLSLWTGRHREPLLRPGSAYVAQVRRRAQAAGGGPGATTELEAPVEVPVVIESPDVLVLVDAWTAGRQGTGGRDRIAELVEVGLDQARRLSKTLTVAVIYASGTPLAGELSTRINALRDPAALAAALPHRDRVPPVALREVPWQQLLRAWEQELRYLDTGGQPVRPFLDHLRARGLR